MEIIKKIQDNLPKQPYILGHEGQPHAAVLLPLVWYEDAYHILFEVRSKDISQGSEISFPGGMYEFGDADYDQTAIRETVEELGIDPETIELVGQMDTMIAGGDLFIHGFVGRLSIQDLDHLPINRDEVDHVFLCPLSYLQEHPPEVHQAHIAYEPIVTDQDGQKKILFPARALGVPEKYHQSWSGGYKTIYVYRYQDYLIWGITGQFLQSFLDML